MNAIINYLEIALEGALDQETRDNLAKSHSASKSLIYVINDLLDLTKAEEGQDLIKDEIFDLPATIREATDSFKGDAKRKGLKYELTEHPGIPRFVHGDQQRVRQAVANIIANAMQHTTSGWIHVELWLQEMLDNRATVEIVVQDSGAGMSNDKLDALFRDLEEVTSDVGGMFETEDARKRLSEGKEKRTLGLGLAMVARLVRNMDGQLRLKSEEGNGSRFVIQLSFAIPDDSQILIQELRPASVGVNPAPSLATSPPPKSEGEVTLIDNGSSMRADGVIRKRSIDEVTSLHSFRSGSSNKSTRSNKSDVDRLIEAISGPLAAGEPEKEERTLQITKSKGSGHNRKSAASLASAPSPNATNTDRPGQPRRSKSYGTLGHPRYPQERAMGAEFVTDNRTLMKAVKMPDEFSENFDHSSGEAMPNQVASRVVFDIPNENKHTLAQQDAQNLQILVAEDDPVNSRIIRKRLEKSGHEVFLTINGEECATAFGEKQAHFDVVLMDMQMPIVDGLTSTKMIRSYEKSHSQLDLSSRAAANGRVPILAVSASLVERERQTYISAGFDGWILKPIDFKRLTTLLSGIVEEEIRNSCLYQPGEWERGGWFTKRQPSVFDAQTNPSGPSGKTTVQIPPGNERP